MNWKTFEDLPEDCPGREIVLELVRGHERPDCIESTERMTTWVFLLLAEEVARLRKTTESLAQILNEVLLTQQEHTERINHLFSRSFDNGSGPTAMDGPDWGPSDDQEKP